MLIDNQHTCHVIEIDGFESRQKKREEKIRRHYHANKPLRKKPYHKKIVLSDKYGVEDGKNY